MTAAALLLSMLFRFVPAQAPAASQPTAPPRAERLTIEVGPSTSPPAPQPLLVTYRISSADLSALLDRPDLPGPLSAPHDRDAARDALSRINTTALLDYLEPLIERQFGGRFARERDVLYAPVPAERQATLDAADVQREPYRGPAQETIGFLVHDCTETEFLTLAIRVIQTARQLVETGDPRFDRTSPRYYRWLAEAEVAELRGAKRSEALADAERRETRRKVAAALGLKDPENEDGSAGNWLKESRRFSYIIKEGKFIDRLHSVVEEINRQIQMAGYVPPPELERAGIHYDAQIGDVDIVLPAAMLNGFLARADEFERRMAEDLTISIEAVRLTDREIVEGALASRVSAQIQGVHDVDRFKKRTILRELGLNSLLAVANQQLQRQTLSGVAAGALPAGTPPLQVTPPTLPPIDITEEFTTLGSTFSVGADDVFFDGRQQVTGFSYIGPDGIAHTLTTEVVDSLRELWERIERNLIVHHIKKTGGLTEFSVPVGPNTRTYKGIAALISQENQQLIVATGTGAISEIKATAGTWLVIENFEITPIPGSSTALTQDEKDALEARLLLTMFLRDRFIPVEVKRELLAMRDLDALRARLLALFDEHRQRPVRPDGAARTYAIVHDERLRETLADEEFEKKERNSKITLTFFSSQGNIIQSPGTTQLGDANDLTSFTTELNPNVVTPISSFFTKSGNGLIGTSSLTGVERGERRDEERSMTHLVIRSRFPTARRQRADRQEGRYLGYFDLPIQRDPNSDVDVPFLSGSEHPLERLAKLRIGLLFPVLDANRVKRPLSRLNPNRFPGDIPKDAWETATARFLMNRKIISDSPAVKVGLESDFVARFVTEVRSLLEFDDDFFNSPSVALRNLGHWNDSERIILALNNSPGRFALDRLVVLVDELGSQLVPDDYVNNYLAVSPPSGLHSRRIYPLSFEQVRDLRRDVAAHLLRFREAYGDAFLEAVCNVLRLGSYRVRTQSELCRGILRGYRDLVLFDQGGSIASDPAGYRKAHENFLFLKRGGHRGRLFEPSYLSLEHMAATERGLVYRGTDILRTANHALAYDP